MDPFLIRAESGVSLLCCSCGTVDIVLISAATLTVNGSCSDQSHNLQGVIARLAQLGTCQSRSVKRIQILEVSLLKGLMNPECNRMVFL